MPGGGPLTAIAPPQSWGFMPTGITQAATIAASTLTFTLGQFVSTAPYAPQCAFWNQGAAAANSVVFVAFGSTSVTVSATAGVPIVPLGLMGQEGSKDLQVISTGKTPQQVMAIGGAGTTTVWITPGEGSR